MKELFRERDITRVSYYEMVLKGEGIQTIIRNQHLTMAGLTEIPIPEFFPALCVVDDSDYERAVELIRAHLEESRNASTEEIPCPSCGELNPGNFELCWSCNESIAGE